MALTGAARNGPEDEERRGPWHCPPAAALVPTAPALHPYPAAPRSSMVLAEASLCPAQWPNPALAIGLRLLLLLVLLLRRDGCQ